ncbi:hypothetical protein [Halegenticoccus tardaugens]|uniref:hypothetical protein n=1 Tax=Halegenticoccus tardaugens TaxID=2071624 RepID=UPI00100A83E1|nr:hypothetical protein [Halegenticoccus tardaugens]
MTRLYLVPVGKDWIDHFESTVSTPIHLPEDHPIPELEDFSEVRIWGTTKSKRKRRFFEAMESGDLLLFYNEGEFFATGRVSQTFENPEAGNWLWNSASSRFIYTVTDFQRISIPRAELNRILGYSDNYIPQGFMQVSEQAINRLLQQYTSVEEAFQDFRNSTVDPPTAGDQMPHSAPDVEEEDQEVREHTEIQWYLIQLGLKHNYDVYVAKNDRNLVYEGQRLGEECVDSLHLTGFSDAAMRIIEYVDVIWLDGDYIVKLFEVESTTNVYSGILRMTDFVVKVPNLAVDMYIAAPLADMEKVRREMDRPTFRHVLARAEHCSLQYLSFEEIREKNQTVERAGALQTVF